MTIYAKVILSKGRIIAAEVAKHSDKDYTFFYMTAYSGVRLLN